MELKNFKSIWKITTFFKLELFMIILVISSLVVGSFITFQKTISDVNKIGADVINVKSELVLFHEELNLFMSEDFKSFNYNDDTTKYNKNINDYKIYLKYLNSNYISSNDSNQLFDIKKVDNFLNKKKEVYNEYFLLKNSNILPKKHIKKILNFRKIESTKQTLFFKRKVNDIISYDSNIVDMERYSKEIIINKEKKDLELSKLESINTEYNLLINDELKSYTNYLKFNIDSNIIVLSAKIRDKIEGILIIFLILIPIFTISLILLILDIKKLFKRGERTESVIESIINTSKKG